MWSVSARSCSAILPVGRDDARPVGHRRSSVDRSWHRRGCDCHQAIVIAGLARLFGNSGRGASGSACCLARRANSDSCYSLWPPRALDHARGRIIVRGGVTLFHGDYTVSDAACRPAQAREERSGDGFDGPDSPGNQRHCGWLRPVWPNRGPMLMAKRVGW